MVYIKLHHGYTFSDISNHKLFQQRAGPFEIINKVVHLVYELKLFFRIFIHPMISIAQSEPAFKNPEFYGRQRDQHPFPVQIESFGDAPVYEIEHFVNKKTFPSGKVQYRMQLNSYGPEYNVWYEVDDFETAKTFINDYEKRFRILNKKRGH